MDKHERNFIPLNFAILTISDSRDKTSDKSGDLLENCIVSAGHKVVDRQITTDEKSKISTKLVEWAAEPNIDAVITTGGTGLTGRDVTVEAHRSVYEKEIDAFAPVFAVVSMKSIGSSAIQSRACAGVREGTYFFALPGSPSACRDAWDDILKAQFDSRNRPCNLVEILPRLEEHLLRN